MRTQIFTAVIRGKKQMILFICTGNTCRSPIAAAIAKSFGLDAQSAGIMTCPGSPASSAAIRTANRHGINLTGHRSQPVTEELLIKAEQVWVMTPDHWDALNMIFCDLAAKADVLEPAIPDPYGGGDDAYERCFQRLLYAMRRAGIIPKQL